MPENYCVIEPEDKDVTFKSSVIENGIVIDHIPKNKVFDILHFFDIDIQNLDDKIVDIISNLPSQKVEGGKTKIKIFDKDTKDYPTKKDYEDLRSMAPVTLNLIKNYGVFKKYVPSIYLEGSD